MTRATASGMRTAAGIWGRTLAATSGTLAFLLSLFPWGVSGQRTIQEATFALTLNLTALLPIAGTMVPGIGRNMQGFVILGLGTIFLTVWLAMPYLVLGGFFLPLTFVVTFAAMILLGGGLVLLSNRS
jgi:hypothetical protein